MTGILARYALLSGLLFTTIWWCKGGGWDAKAGFFLALASYIGSDAYAATRKSKENGHDYPLFCQFIQDVPSNGSISFIRDFGFGDSSFELSRLRDLDTYHHKWRDAEHEFLTPKLERLRLEFSESLINFLGLVSVNTFPTHNPGWNRIPDEWEENDPARFRQVSKMLNDAADKVVNAHQQLVRACRRTIKEVPTERA
jgi:hypothetical protein